MGYHAYNRLPLDPTHVKELAMEATLKAYALRVGQVAGDGRVSDEGESFPFDTRGGSTRKLERQDLREKVRIGWGSRLVVFLVDASDSMDVAHQLAAAKGAVLLLLSGAYVRRDRIALVAFQGERAKVVVPPTTSFLLAREKLSYLLPAGATPLADGLLTAWKLIRTERLKYPKREVVLVVLSDGEGNVPLEPGADQKRELEGLAEVIKKERIHVVWVDTTPEGKEGGSSRRLATLLGAEYQPLRRMGSHGLAELITKDSP